MLEEETVMVPPLKRMGSELVPTATSVPSTIMEAPFKFTVTPGSIAKIVPLFTVNVFVNV